MKRNNNILKSLQKISNNQSQKTINQNNSSNSNNRKSDDDNSVSDSSISNATASSLQSFLQSSASSNNSSSSSSVSSSSNDSDEENNENTSSSSNTNENDVNGAAENQLARLEQSAKGKITDDDSTDENKTSVSSNNSANMNGISQSQIDDAKQNYQPTPNEQTENNDEQQIESLKNNSNNSNSATNLSSESAHSNSISASDPATTQQGQKNLAKNEKEHQPDLQDITSPNLFIVRARNFHNKMSRLLDKYAYSKNVSGDVINYIISLEDESFKNLCNGFSMIIKDNNRRNNEVEARTEHLQKKASAGAETIKIWQNEGIFANLKDEIGELSDVIHDPRFQAFAQKTKTADLNIPKTLKVKGTVAKKNVDKAEAQSKQTKGGKK